MSLPLTPPAPRKTARPAQQQIDLEEHLKTLPERSR